MRNGGEVQWLDPDFPSPVVVRFTEAGGRLVIESLYVGPGAEPLTASLLRRLPLGRIEAFVNGNRDVSANVRSRLEGRAGRLAAIDSTLGSPADVKTPVTVESMLEVEIPVTRDRGDEFYQAVGTAYAAALALGHRAPARAIAEANGVPVTTVHRWVKEARRRGLWAPSGRGKD